MSNQPQKVKNKDYLREKEEISTFLQTFVNIDGKLIYLDMIEKVSKRQQILFPIKLDDILASQKSTSVILVENIESNTLRYISLFSDCIDELISPTAFDSSDTNWDTIDLLVEQQMQKHKEKERILMEEDGDQPIKLQLPVPKIMLRRYEIQFIPKSSTKTSPLRMIKANNIGKMVLVKGIVTRVSDVKSELLVATYICDRCGTETFQEVTNCRTYAPLSRCSSEKCKKEQSDGNLNPQTRGCKFRKMQEIIIQETTEETPQGSIPRMMTIYARGELTRLCSPGDEILVNGIFLPAPVSGMKAMKQGPVSTTYVEALFIERVKKRYGDYTFDDEDIEDISSQKNFYSLLANSICPEIYGHEDVKKALLLMLVGGVTKQMGDDGMKIRGDLNICLMGDPGVAKSQLLRSVAKLSPRGVYTTGKGSSGVGLTASVVKDPLTGEFVLEGGALVLSDNGICCIDEFDKMEERDRTALHEVMAQQSISIAKAGIATTLNARTSILAAANPHYGRYNPKKSPTENINLPVSLLSRFDLLFLILDKQNEEMDKHLAQHITFVHQNKKAPETTRFISLNQLRTYISHAKRYNSSIPKHLTEYIADAYVEIRSSEVEDGKSYTTPRTLLSLLRISQALARLRLSFEVKKSDVDEAIRLMNSSKISLEDDTYKRYDPISDIYNIIRNKAKSTNSKIVKINEIESAIFAKGFKGSDLGKCLEEYESINIWSVNEDKTQIEFLD